jgi:hypothetical protein
MNMTKEEYRVLAELDTTNISESQLKHMTEWIEAFIKSNLDTLKNEGVKPMDIYRPYLESTKWPCGPKAFAPCLHMFGLEKVGGGKKGFKYVMFD